MKRPRLHFRRTILLLIIAAAVVFWAVRNRMPDTEYRTVRLVSGDMRSVVRTNGIVEALVSVQVGSQVSGQIRELYADFNSNVRAGQLLARIDPRNFEADVENSRAQVLGAEARVRMAKARCNVSTAALEGARANSRTVAVSLDHAATLFTQAEELSAQGLASAEDVEIARSEAELAQNRYDQSLAAVSEAEAERDSVGAQLEQAQAELAQASATLSRAQANLATTSIYSPVSGVVLARTVDVGQTLAATMQSPHLVTIATDLRKMRLNASIDEADIGKISSDMRIDFTVDAYPNDVFHGDLAEIRLSPTTTQNVVTYSMIVNVDNSALKLKPGMTAHLTCTLHERRNVLRIPEAALKYTPPGAERPRPLRGNSGSPRTEDWMIEQSAASGSAAARTPPDVPLAPGQKWDPKAKIKLPPAERPTVHDGTVWVIGRAGQLERRPLVLGISDGAYSELISGQVTANDALIVSDSSAEPSAWRFNFRIPGMPAGGGGRGR